MKKLLILLTIMFVTLITVAYITIFQFPNKTWVLDDPTISHTMKAGVFVSGIDWCGQISYSNDEDCEFILLVTAPGSDTLYHYPIKAPADSKEKRYKLKNFTLNYHKKLTIKYIPVKVKKNTKMVLKFSNTLSCKN